MQIEQKPKRLVKRRGIDLSKPKVTDQSYKKACCINNIVKAFFKTGTLPSSSKVGSYGDFSELPSLESSFEAVRAAKDAFYKLPSTIRKLIDNDPSKLEEFIANSENKELCYKYGLLKKPEEKAQETQKVAEKVEKPEDNDVSTESTTESSKTSPTS